MRAKDPGPTGRITFVNGSGRDVSPMCRPRPVALTAADGDLKTALVHLLTGADVESSAAALAVADGHVREALRALGG